MQNSSQMPWWHREKKDGLGAKIQQIQRVNDPTTYADEVLTGSKVLLTLLLVFSGLLGALSYFKNFSISFPIELAMFLALTLTIVIEWGKFKAATWAVRIPFFHGWRYLGTTPSNTFIFIGLVLVALASFGMSVYNSTKGGEQLALMLSHEKNDSAFSPDTKEIDTQLAAVQGSITNAPMSKWKGKMYYQDAKAVRSANKSAESLQRQREESVKHQRADYERQLAVQSSQSSFAGKLVLASGGWVEFLQIILILIRVACERSLAGRMAPAPPRQPAPTGPQQPIGFNVGMDGNVHRNDGGGASVSQMPQAVTQTNDTPVASVFLSSEEALLYFESELRKEPSHFQNKHANESTVANRISNKLIRAERYLTATPDHSIPKGSADRFEEYLTKTLYPILEERNYCPNRAIINLLQSKKA